MTFKDIVFCTSNLVYYFPNGQFLHAISSVDLQIAASNRIVNLQMGASDKIRMAFIFVKFPLTPVFYTACVVFRGAGGWGGGGGNLRSFSWADFSINIIEIYAITTGSFVR